MTTERMKKDKNLCDGISLVVVILLIAAGFSGNQVLTGISIVGVLFMWLCWAGSSEAHIKAYSKLDEDYYNMLGEEEKDNE